MRSTVLFCLFFLSAWAFGQDKSVKPGINEKYVDPKMNVQEMVDMFEGESREIYASREAILAALQLQPGQRVADIGAGTGFFSFMFADKVGAKGHVYAVDISVKFLEHIKNAAQAKKMTYVTPVLGGDRSPSLQPGSVDVIFICDTYHHFEYPLDMLKSMHAALTKGGKLVVIDFKRIQGKSPDWIMGHVRAGQEVFRQEIEAVGFKYEKDLQIKGLVDNYAMQFAKK